MPLERLELSRPVKNTRFTDGSGYQLPNNGTKVTLGATRGVETFRMIECSSYEHSLLNWRA